MCFTTLVLPEKLRIVSMNSGPKRHTEIAFIKTHSILSDWSIFIISNLWNVFVFLLLFSYRVPHAFRVLATPGIVGEVHVERRHIDHDMHSIDDDFQQRASDE